MAPNPHPEDPTILHGPASGCAACNALPEYQKIRVAIKIAFTGEEPKDGGWSPCPSTLIHPTYKEMIDSARHRKASFSKRRKGLWG
jgi:hypothetical protein